MIRVQQNQTNDNTVLWYGFITYKKYKHNE